MTDEKPGPRIAQPSALDIDSEDGIDLVRVVHGGRDLQSILGEGRGFSVECKAIRARSHPQILRDLGLGVLAYRAESDYYRYYSSRDYSTAFL